MLDLVRRLAAEGAAVCLSTHQLDEVEELGASVALLHHGRLVAHDRVADLVARHGQAVVDLRFDADVAGLQLVMEGLEVHGRCIRIARASCGTLSEQTWCSSSRQA